MAELMQLDKAAALVGKSEVTLRRLIKSGRIPFEKEKTLTGFIYLVDPDHVRTYYQAREGSVFNLSPEDIIEEAGEQPRSGPAAGMGHQVRVAIAGESGNAFEYWQKKSELYEEKYNHEIVKHAQTREELGVWRGRAEQSQAMLMKLLPSGGDVEVRPAHQASMQMVQQEAAKREEVSLGMIFLVAFLIVLLIAAVGAVIYLKYAIR